MGHAVKEKFIENYAFCKNVTYKSKAIFKEKRGHWKTWEAEKSTLSGPHIPVPTFPLSTPGGGG